jgi:putative flippase GtrA
MLVNTLSATTFSQKVEQLLVRKPVILQILRFVVIGGLNTALDFVILNAVAKSFGIISGWQLAAVNVASFTIAVIQSYLWNKTWAFGHDAVSPFTNALRLVGVGSLGFGALLAVVIGSAFGLSPLFFLTVFVIFVLGQILLWHLYGLHFTTNTQNTSKQFTAFIVISVIGLLINTAIVGLVSAQVVGYLATLSRPDLAKNVAKVLATIISLMWNFAGYKFIVFKE